MLNPVPVTDERRTSRGGFSLLEVAFTLALIGTLAAVVVPRVGDLIRNLGTRDAAVVVAAELEHARTLAARLRVPVRVKCLCNAGALIVEDRSSGEVLRRVQVTGVGGGMGVQKLALSVAQVDVFPSGMTSGPLTVSLTTATRKRSVVMTSAGLVRVLP